MELDEQLVRRGSELEPLQKRFVCVRVVMMEDVDLGLFQIDYDQILFVFFLNADGTIYGRYGTRAGNGADSTTHVSVASFGKAMERALELHQGYPANKDQLAGKQGPEPEYREAKKIPAVDQRRCIECHQVWENLLRLKWKESRLTPADVWAYPLPENIGLKMEVNDGLRVKAVEPHSPAREAEIVAGDALVTLGGQRLISQADIQWVLNQAPGETKLAATLNRKGMELEKTIVLRGTWKQSDLSWRPSTGPGLRYGLLTVPLSDAEKKAHDFSVDRLGLRVKKWPPRGRHRSNRQACGPAMSLSLWTARRTR